jgi:hypothetical protein
MDAGSLRIRILTMKTALLLLLLVAPSVLAAGGHPAYATNLYFRNTSGGAWTTVTNWWLDLTGTQGSGYAPTNNDSVVFYEAMTGTEMTSGPAASVTLTTLTVGSMIFSNITVGSAFVIDTDMFDGMGGMAVDDENPANSDPTVALGGFSGGTVDIPAAITAKVVGSNTCDLVLRGGSRTDAGEIIGSVTLVDNASLRGGTVVTGATVVLKDMAYSESPIVAASVTVSSDTRPVLPAAAQVSEGTTYGSSGLPLTGTLRIGAGGINGSALLGMP